VTVESTLAILRATGTALSDGELPVFADEQVWLRGLGRDDEGHRRASAVAGELARIWRAMMLAPCLEVCEALLRGESVPVHRLDSEWVKRFGTRR
jgi:hypothetical protein